MEIFGRRSPVSIPYASYELELQRYPLSEILPVYGVRYLVYVTESVEVPYEPDIDALIDEKLRALILELPDESRYISHVYNVRDCEGYRMLSLSMEIERVIGGGI